METIAPNSDCTKTFRQMKRCKIYTYHRIKLQTCYKRKTVVKFTIRLPVKIFSHFSYFNALCNETLLNIYLTFPWIYLISLRDSLQTFLNCLQFMLQTCTYILYWLLHLFACIQLVIRKNSNLRVAKFKRKELFKFCKNISKSRTLQDRSLEPAYLVTNVTPLIRP